MVVSSLMFIYRRSCQILFLSYPQLFYICPQLFYICTIIKHVCLKIRQSENFSSPFVPKLLCSCFVLILELQSNRARCQSDSVKTCAKKYPVCFTRINLLTVSIAVSKCSNNNLLKNKGRARKEKTMKNIRIEL